MKNVLKYVVIVATIVLGGVVIGGTTYMVLKNDTNTNVGQQGNDKNDGVLDKEKPDDIIEDKDKNDKPLQEIKIDKATLEKYLGYIPKPIMSSKGAYGEKSITITDIPKEIILANLIDKLDCLDIEDKKCPFDNSKPVVIDRNVACEYPDMCPPEGETTNRYIPFSYLNSETSKMYNYRLPMLANAKDPSDIMSIGTSEYYYKDGNLVSLWGGGGYDFPLHISVTEDYKATENELIIYEYAAEFDTENKILKDYYNGYQKELAGWCGNTEYSEYQSIVTEYLRNNKTGFTKYKHTFKKNNDAYYWNKTEVM